MEIIFLPRADDDLNYWIKTKNKRVLKRIAQLTDSILKSPFKGIVKPESLKYALSGKWSRRITEVDRYIYEVNHNILKVYSLKGHY